MSNKGATSGKSVGGGIVNYINASEQAVSIFSEALRYLKETPVVKIPISETTKIAISPKADNPKNAKLEAELQALAKENGYKVEFSTKTKTSVYTKSTSQLEENFGENKIQIKTRFVIIRRTQYE